MLIVNAGWVTSRVHRKRGRSGHVVGIVGGLLGGFLLRLFGVDVEGGGLWFSFFTCLGGAVVLLFLVGLVTGRSRV
ncbi:GlsB/YeaQ/YmgE family stress response membrane protein [Nocardia asteroides]